MHLITSTEVAVHDASMVFLMCLRLGFTSFHLLIPPAATTDLPRDMGRGGSFNVTATVVGSTVFCMMGS